jgi:hypothetical protein
LIVLLQKRIFNESHSQPVESTSWNDYLKVNIDMFRQEYPRFPTIDEVCHISSLCIPWNLVFGHFPPFKYAEIFYQDFVLMRIQYFIPFKT